MSDAAVVIQRESNSSLLQTWTSAICSSETFVGLMKSSRNKFSNVVADVTGGRVVANKEDRIRVKMKLSIQFFCVTVRKGGCKAVKRAEMELSSRSDSLVVYDAVSSPSEDNEMQSATPSEGKMKVLSPSEANGYVERFEPKM